MKQEIERQRGAMLRVKPRTGRERGTQRCEAEEEAPPRAAFANSAVSGHVWTPSA
jgi:hypothetical protein